ncbi:GGDEF domain-containing protein [Kushneria aurantia]|uniref:diguanylate cyclase n=1 Tax=Kushneria aurantia TaxID=504092 RepID=A0ABV6G1W8_9GAMM|nr:GGDEF domain-containing protein [Kushneria aurantia]
MRQAVHRSIPFLLPLALAGIALLLIRSQWLPHSLVDVVGLLPWLIGALGSVLSLVYDRIRTLFLIIILLLAYQLLMPHLHFMLRHGEVRADTQLTFLLTALLLPPIFTLFALWRERAHPFKDILLRLIALGVLLLGARIVQQYFSGQLSNWLLDNWLPLPSFVLLPLPQPIMLTFAISFGALTLPSILDNRPAHAAQLVAMSAFFWTLPYIFRHPEALTLVTTAALIMLSAALVHESFHMAFVDELTGLPGRRALNEKLQRLGRRYTLAMTDVDHFKKFNDTHGHDVGDQVLKMVAAQLRGVTGGGKAYRYGGEEFTIVFPGKSIAQCLPHIEAVRESIENYVMQPRDRNTRPGDDRKGAGRRTGSARAAGGLSVTISIGVAERTAQLATPEEVIKAADKSLYKAKNAGRNCVMAHGSRAPAKRKRAG